MKFSYACIVLNKPCGRLATPACWGGGFKTWFGFLEWQVAPLERHFLGCNGRREGGPEPPNIGWRSKIA